MLGGGLGDAGWAARAGSHGSWRCYPVDWPESTPARPACDMALRGLSRPGRL